MPRIAALLALLALAGCALRGGTAQDVRHGDNPDWTELDQSHLANAPRLLPP